MKGRCVFDRESMIGRCSADIHVLHLGAFVLAVIRQLVHSEDRAVVVLRDFDRVAQMIRVPVSQQDGVDFDVFRVRSGSGIARQEGIDDDARLRRFHQQR
ncbi:hypothetical protein D3C71_1664990 [compost metagenome]